MRPPAAVERIAARVLWWGGLLSVALILGSLVAYVWQGQPHAQEIVRAVQDRGAGPGPDVFATPAAIRQALAHRPPDPLGVIAVGLLCLLATPVVGVALVIPAFWREGDRTYALIAAAVLAMLLVGFALSLGA
jgi:uncharacterized membrane protein